MCLGVLRGIGPFGGIRITTRLPSRSGRWRGRRGWRAFVVLAHQLLAVPPHIAQQECGDTGQHQAAFHLARHGALDGVHLGRLVKREAIAGIDPYLMVFRRQRTLAAHVVDDAATPIHGRRLLAVLPDQMLMHAHQLADVGMNQSGALGDEDEPDADVADGFHRLDVRRHGAGSCAKEALRFIHHQNRPGWQFLPACGVIKCRNAIDGDAIEIADEHFLARLHRFADVPDGAE